PPPPMPFRPTLPRRCPHDRKLTSFLSAVASLANAPSRSPPAGAVPAAATPSAYNALMSAYSRAGRPDEVLRLFRSLPFPPTAPLFTTLISSLADSGHYRAARAAFSSLLVSGHPPTVSTFTAMLKAHGPVSANGVYHIFGAMIAVGCAPDAAAYNCLISILCDNQRVEEALGILEFMADNEIRPTIRSYTAVLRGYSETVNILFDCLCRDTRFSEAVCLLECSGKLGWEVDVFCYNTLMSRLCEVGDFARVLKLLVDLIKKGIGPDMFSFTIAIRSLCGAGKFQVAKYLLDNERMAYDVVAFNTLIHGLCVVGNLHGVIQIYMDMISRNVAPNNFTIAMVIDSLCKQEKFLTAINFLVEPSVKYLVPDHESLGKCLVPDYESSGKHLVLDLESFGKRLVPDHFVRMTNWLVKAKGLGYVLILLRKIRSKGLALDVCVFNSLVRIFCWEGYCKHENFYEVSLILDSMLDCLSSQQTT
ncbi:hypothetical protein SETIT_9G489600v2, partial [Setaria italica]